MPETSVDKHDQFLSLKAEDKRNQLSDDELVDRTGESEMLIARRTITNYRKMLNIPSSRERREW